ncbi:hypothetical protein PFFCH_02495, partial [Plasmodium falciparum FCH/4]
GEAQTQLGQNKSSLLGDIKKAEFKNKAVKVGALNKVCELTKDHTNDSRHGTDEYKGPCTGKDGGNERFNAGTKWEGDNFVSATHKNLYIPPRRQHMCTSNLEKLDFLSVTSKSNVNDSFLGDVLLAANNEAQRTKDHFAHKKDDHGIACRSVRYSFADLGDIIRGRDMWEHSDQTQLQGDLKTVFGKIKKQFNDKYATDDPKHTKLRADWWEANRDQVWDAMKCPKNGVHITCDSGVPVDDYIPQRLRWMTEWAEWYCKAQSQEYNKLMEACGSCKIKGQGQSCTSSDPKCTKCKEACDKYTKVVREWEEQWNNMLLQYTLLYWQAQITARYGGTRAYSGDVGDKDKPVVQFLEELQKQNSGKTTYDTAAGYIHQEARVGECEVQKYFCNTNGNRDKYVFRSKPNDYDDECNCDKKTASSPEELGRSDSFDDHQTPRADTKNTDEPDEDDDDDEEEEDEDTTDETEEETAKVKEDTEDTGKGSEPSASQEDTVDVCETVEEALKLDTLKQACSTKYEKGREKFPNWKCIPTSGAEPPTKSSDSGATCIPPRRRRLYVTPLTKWATNMEATQTSGDQKTPSEKLRTAFIQSAAIETFFLWHKYKAENTKTQGSVVAPLPQLPGSGSGDPDPQTQLKRGHIPPDFLRLMFYTLADYKDILFSGSNDNTKSSTYNDILRGDKEIAQREMTIKDAIERVLKNGDSQPPSGDKREQFWKQHGPDIWNGMICALTYTDSEGKEQPTQDPTVKKAFFGDKDNPGTQNGSPLPQPGTTGKPGTQNGTYQEKYQYNSVKLDENSDTDGAKQTKAPAPSDTPTLTDFISRPPYFRYLEEWGQNFCKERKKRLEKIKDDCKVEEKGKNYCDGEGFECTQIVKNEETKIKTVDYPSCADSCRWYKRWIEKKKIEFEEQKEAYDKQKTKCHTQSKDATSNNNAKEFCEKIEKCETAGDFLERLKNGSCKTDNEKDKTDFKEAGKTFKHTEYCDPCSEFKINCKENGKCSDEEKRKCNGTTVITKDDIKDSTEDVVMLVSDNGENGFENDLNECKDKVIFEGIREDVWECGKFCGLHLCGLKKDNNHIDEKQIILIRALFKRWVEYFLEDYNKINAKISHCINSGNKSTCTNDCPNKCKCVRKWIEKKKNEWKEIKKHYLKQYENADESYPVKTFLEELIPQITDVNVKNDQESVIKLSQFDTSCGCNAKASSTNGKNEDAIDCMLNKLQQKAKKCEENHKPSGENKNQECVDSSTPVEEDEEDLLLEEENTEEAKKKMVPTFCKDMVQIETAKEEPHGTCDGADTSVPKVHEEEVGTAQEPAPPAESGKETPVLEPEKEAPSPSIPQPQPPSRQPQNPFEHPLLKPALMSSTIMWSIGIGFAAFTYFFLKKKTKASVGNLFQILQIPKGDYNIPTLKSSNRYIPYVSDTYKGKTYIYMEGDSDEDKYAFMSDTTDVTSSESEYEELDINDIYAPRAPKYKTLIEVVLEPSGNNTTASGKNTPSDTQNDIQNDGIPSSKITDNEWNTLKDDFISNMLQSEQPKDVPNDYSSGDIPFNTQPNTLYFDNNQEKPFITSIHDRNLYTGEEYSYNVNMVNNDNIPINRDNNPYSGIDLINDSLNSNKVDIYDELLKRKENELFGTEHHPKHTNIYNVAKPARDDPITNQINLFHKWLDRHRDMCEKWDTNNKVDILNQLKEEWENDNSNSGNKTSGNITPTSDIPSGKLSDIPSTNKMLNSDVSIQIHIDKPNQVDDNIYLDTYPDKYTVDNINPVDTHTNPNLVGNINPVDQNSNLTFPSNPNPAYDNIYIDHNNEDLPSKVQIEMSVKNGEMAKEK